MAFLRHPERNEADLRVFMHCSSGSSCSHCGLLSALLGKGRKAFKTLPDFRPEWKGMRPAMRADANDDEAKFPGVRDELIRATFKGDCGHWRAKMMKVPCIPPRPQSAALGAHGGSWGRYRVPR